MNGLRHLVFTRRWNAFDLVVSGVAAIAISRGRWLELLVIFILAVVVSVWGEGGIRE